MYADAQRGVAIFSQRILTKYVAFFVRVYVRMSVTLLKDSDDR